MSIPSSGSITSCSISRIRSGPGCTSVVVMTSLYTMSVKKTQSADDEIVAVLVRTLRALGAAGRPVQALRLAASGYASLRHERPAAAERLNAVMHSLARLPPEEPPTTPQEATVPDTTLDVRAEIPARRHELIFETFASLSSGTAFELVNDLSLIH